MSQPNWSHAGKCEMPRFAANLSMMFNELPFLDRFAEAAECGFEAVEFLFPYDFDPEEIARRLDDAGLVQVLFNMPPGNWDAGDRGLAALPERRDEFRRSVATALRFGRILEVPNLHMMAGIASPDDPVAIASYRDSLRFVADITGEAGICLLIEPLNGRDMPGYFLNHFDRAAAFIEELAHPALKLQFDIYHREILHGGVIASLEKMIPLIGHIQVASVPDRNEPGSGTLDDFAVFEALDALGYAGWVGCEYRPAGSTRDGLAWLERTTKT
jgi:hydroxypyruvate isomerase